MYGTVLYFDTSKRGNEHTVLMNVETVNDHYLANTSVLNEVLGLLHTAIFEPNLENGVFKESVVEREKRQLFNVLNLFLMINLALHNSVYNKS